MRTVTPFGSAVPVVPQAPRKPLAKFGCRLFAYMASEPYRNQDKFIRQALVDGQNSLQKQSGKTMDEETESGRLPWGAFVSDVRQEDGWGIARYDKPAQPNPFITLSNLHAAKDPGYEQTVNSTAAAKPLSMLVHIRQGPNAVRLNNHPFQFQRWSFMHNGLIPEGTVMNLEPDVTRYSFDYGHPRPQGTTDTERIFYFLMGRMRETLGTTDASRIHTPQLKMLFAEVVRDLLQSANDEGEPWIAKVNDRFERLTGLRLKGSAVHVPVGANFILSDGDRTLAARSGRELHLGVRNGANGAKEVLIATQPMQPKKSSRLALVTWFEIPDQHLVIVERRNGELQVTLEPLLANTGPILEAGRDDAVSSGT